MKPIDLASVTNRPIILGALIIAAAILTVGAATIYFSPFQTCIRGSVGQTYNGQPLTIRGAQALCLVHR